MRISSFFLVAFLAKSGVCAPAAEPRVAISVSLQRMVAGLPGGLRGPVLEFLKTPSLSSVIPVFKPINPDGASHAADASPIEALAALDRYDDLYAKLAVLERELPRQGIVDLTPLETVRGLVAVQVSEHRRREIEAEVLRVDQAWQSATVASDASIVSYGEKRPPQRWRLAPFSGTGKKTTPAALDSPSVMPITASVSASDKPGVMSAVLRYLKRWAGRSHVPNQDATPIDEFTDARHGLRLDLYASFIQHVRDLDPAVAQSLRKRYLTALRQSPEKLPEILKEMAAERIRAGFPFEPARIDTALHRQTGSRYQAIVEMVNNGFDAMGDAIGRFGVGVYQAIGLLENDGDSLAYRSVSAAEPGRVYSVRFHRAEGQLWVKFGSEAAAATDLPGTEAVLKLSASLDAPLLREYLGRKLSASRRGVIEDRSSGQPRALNDLSSYRGLSGRTVAYRLGANKVVRLEIRDGGKEISIKDSGKGLGAETAMEALPVPSVSTNRTNAQLHEALGRHDPTANGAEVLYRDNATPEKEGKASFLVGGTEVETMVIRGESLATEVILDLPTGADQKEARTQVVLDRMTVAAIKQLVDDTVSAFEKDPIRLGPVVNSLAVALKNLQEQNRIKSLRREDDLYSHLRARVMRTLESLNSDYVAVPASVDLKLSPAALAGRRPVPLDARLWDFDPSTVGGEPLAGSGKAIWSVPMDQPYAKVGDRILLSRAAVERQRQDAFEGHGPVLLNDIINVFHDYGQRPEPEAVMAGQPPARSEMTIPLGAREATSDVSVAQKKSDAPTREDDIRSNVRAMLESAGAGTQAKISEGLKDFALSKSKPCIIHYSTLSKTEFVPSPSTAPMYSILLMRK